MTSSLKDKVVLITAAGQGIGRATALAFAARGARVIGTDINEAALETLGRETGISARRLDVLDTNAVNALASDVGAVDVLVNCAGVVHSGSILEASDQDFDLAMDLNVRSMIRTIRATLPGMLARGSGAVINIASVASSLKGLPNRFVYGTSKAAVIGLTKSVAAEYVTRGVTCNAICPGTVESPSLEGRMRAQGNYEEARKAFIARQPMGRLGLPEEIADLAVYLATSPYTTGQAYAIDGGMTL
jgi:2-keto-3-deoxy-L-fuconate dehydrogenase